MLTLEVVEEKIIMKKKQQADSTIEVTVLLSQENEYSFQQIYNLQKLQKENSRKVTVNILEFILPRKLTS